MFCSTPKRQKKQRGRSVTVWQYVCVCYFGSQTKLSHYDIGSNFGNKCNWNRDIHCNCRYVLYKNRNRRRSYSHLKKECEEKTKRLIWDIEWMNEWMNEWEKRIKYGTVHRRGRTGNKSKCSVTLTQTAASDSTITFFTTINSIVSTS
jgi:hypothetical protein